MGRGVGGVPTLRCDGKSAEVIEGKGVVAGPWEERVGKLLERKGIKRSREIKRERGNEDGGRGLVSSRGWSANVTGHGSTGRGVSKESVLNGTSFERSVVVRSKGMREDSMRLESERTKERG